MIKSLQYPYSVKTNLFQSLFLALALMNNDWLITFAICSFVVLFSGNPIRFLKNYFNVIPLLFFGLHVLATLFRWYVGAAPHKTLVWYALAKLGIISNVSSAISSESTSRLYTLLWGSQKPLLIPYLLISFYGLYVCARGVINSSSKNYLPHTSVYEKIYKFISNNLFFVTSCVWLIVGLYLFWLHRDDIVYSWVFFTPCAWFFSHAIKSIKKKSIVIFVLIVCVVIQFFSMRYYFYDEKYWDDNRSNAVAAYILENYSFLIDDHAINLVSSPLAMEATMLLRGDQKNLIMRWDYPKKKVTYSYYETDSNILNNLIDKISSGLGSTVLSWAILLPEQFDKSNHRNVKAKKQPDRFANHGYVPLYKMLFDDPKFKHICLKDGKGRKVYLLISLSKYPAIKGIKSPDCEDANSWVNIANGKYNRFDHLIKNHEKTFKFSR